MSSIPKTIFNFERKNESMGNLITALTKYALILGLAGSLIEETFDLRHKAFEASKGGLISLRSINNALMGNPK